jgi:hypothetical protein
MDATFGEEIRLAGYELALGDREGEYGLTLVWQALIRPSADYTVFVHLLDPAGVCCVWQQDTAPRQGGYLTTRWRAGEIVTDLYSIALPAGLESGSYAIEIGLYLPDSGRRLVVRLPNQPDRDALLLRPLSIPASP